VDNYDLSTIKCFMSAAAPLTKEIVFAVWNRLKIPVTQAYGLSETSPGTHIQVRVGKLHPAGRGPQFTYV
jgi:acyl-coenzyme A synthetase/AMP-(fatty) acid ligase